MRDDLEKILAGESSPVDAHSAECEECREDLAGMREHAALLRGLRAPSSATADGPKAGFYARVMERIEAQSPSIWSLVFDSQFGRRLAMGSMAVALCLGVYLMSSEPTADQPVQTSSEIRIGARPAAMPAELPDQNTVLVNLITYREQ
jgi:anti-sigma factor RsiW